MEQGNTCHSSWKWETCVFLSSENMISGSKLHVAVLGQNQKPGNCKGLLPVKFCMCVVFLGHGRKRWRSQSFLPRQVIGLLSKLPLSSNVT